MSANEKGRPAGTAATLKTATSNTADSADNVADNQQKKPEIDLASWSALGKFSRDRRQKSHRMRRAAR